MATPSLISFFQIFSFPINLMSFRFLWAFSIRSSIFKFSSTFSYLSFLGPLFFYPGYHNLLLLLFDFKYSFSISINLSSISIQLIDDAMCAYIWTFFFLSSFSRCSVLLFSGCLLFLASLALAIMKRVYHNFVFCFGSFFRSLTPSLNFFSFILIPTDVHDLYIIILYPPKKYNVL